MLSALIGICALNIHFISLQKCSTKCPILLLLRNRNKRCESPLVSCAGRYQYLPALSFLFRVDNPSCREGFRALRRSPLAGNQACATPVYGGTKRSYETYEPKHLRTALSSTSFRRGKQRIGGTGAVLHLLCLITVQYSSFAVQQYLAVLQYSQQKLGSAHLQHPAAQLSSNLHINQLWSALQ